MFKFLLYLFIFYVIFRFIFGVLFKGFIKSRTVHFQDHGQHNDHRRPEGHIVVEKPTTKPKKDDSRLGEYVDYEEVK